MLQRKKPVDLILGTGKTHSVREFVEEVFRLQKISKRNLTTNVKKFKRTLDIRSYKADIKLAKKKIKWYPKITFKQIVSKMVKGELY